MPSDQPTSYNARLAHTKAVDDQATPRSLLLLLRLQPARAATASAIGYSQHWLLRRGYRASTGRYCYGYWLQPARAATAAATGPAHAYMTRYPPRPLLLS